MIEKYGWEVLVEMGANKKSFFGALTKEKFSDIIVLVTDRRTESEQPKMKKKCYLYTRVSTAAQIEGYSLEA